MIPWICVAILALGCALLGWRLARGRDRAALLAEQVANLVLAEQQAREQLASVEPRARAEALQTVARELSSAVAIAEAERDKSSRYLVKISDFEQESTRWQNLYTSQSIGHGNAQNLMMRTIEQLARQLQAKGGSPVIPKVLSVIREEFEQKHELPARKIEEALKQGEAQLAAKLAATPSGAGPVILSP